MAISLLPAFSKPLAGTVSRLQCPPAPAGVPSRAAFAPQSPPDPVPQPQRRSPAPRRPAPPPAASEPSHRCRLHGLARAFAGLRTVSSRAARGRRLPPARPLRPSQAVCGLLGARPAGALSPQRAASLHLIRARKLPALSWLHSLRPQSATRHARGAR